MLASSMYLCTECELDADSALFADGNVSVSHPDLRWDSIEHYWWMSLSNVLQESIGLSCTYGAGEKELVHGAPSVEPLN